MCTKEGRMKDADAIIIGAGQGGIPLAIKLAKEGMKTILIEKRYVGGTCVNDGCTPTKTLIASAANAYNIKNSERWGIHVPEFTVDFSVVMERKNEVVRRFRNDNESAIRKTENLTYLKGEASFLHHKEIIVKSDSGTTETLKAENIFIDVGMEPNIPAIKGLGETPFFTTTTILDIDHLPKHLLILGGNYNGLEMAQLFLRLGSEVTVLEKGARLLPKEDPDIADALQLILESEGIRILTGVNAHSVEEDSLTLALTLTFSIGERKGQEIKGSHLLVATGRIPQTDSLALKKAGVETDENGFIIVNDYLETTAPGIFAMGDCKGGPAFTHIAYNDHVVIYNNLKKGAEQKYFDRDVPYCLFTDPQLGRIGMTETEAKAKGKEVKIFQLPMNKSSRGIETGHTEGLMKAVVDKSSGLILGVAILSAQGGEIMSVLQMAMAGGFTVEQLRKQVFAHPLYAESINNLFMS